MQNNQFHSLAKEHANTDIDQATQDKINQTTEVTFSPELRTYLGMILELVESQKINLYAPSSLINQDLYETLDGSAKAEVDLSINSFLGSVRQIVNIHNSPDYADESVEMSQILFHLKSQVETLENKHGDILKI